MFKELYGIATCFVARAPPRSSQKMKRPPETDDLTAHSNYFSSRVEPMLDASSLAESNIHTMTSFVSVSQMTFASSPILIKDQSTGTI